MDWDDPVSEFALTDVGMKRSHNQDSYGIALAPNETVWRTRGHLFIVADGMGAHAVGELASKLAADIIQLSYSKNRGQSPQVALERAITEANQTIHERGQQNKDFEGMGTTATSLVLYPEGALVGHVGDSRCYRIRGNSIDQLSFDHSLQWELAKRQNVSPEKLTSVPSNIIVRSLGPTADVKVDLNGPYPVEEGDRFVLCSDGLSGLISDKEIWAVTSHLPGEEACQVLVDLANLRGGIDNITVVIVEVGGRGKPEKEESRPPWYAKVGKSAAALYKKLPIPWRFYLTGCICAVVGYSIRAAGISGILIGILSIGLLSAAWAAAAYGRKLKARQPEDAPPEPPPVYRSVTCAIDEALVSVMAKLEKHLRELAIEDSWKVDWAKFHQQRNTAESFHKEGHLPDAFCAYCRTLSLLCTGMRGRREKQEVFRPQWERKKSSNARHSEGAVATEESGREG